MNPENLRPPFRKGGSGNPRGRPKEPWRVWLKSERVEPVLREQLLRIALDRRVTVETRVRVSQYLLDHAHGRAKETVEMDTGPSAVTMSDSMYEAVQKMRADAGARTKAADPAPSRNGKKVTP